YDDENAGIRIDAAIAGDESDIFRLEPPAYGGSLHLLEFLFRQSDERRRVVGNGARVQRLEEGGLGDKRLAGAGRSADEHALLGGEPGEQGFFLHGIGRVRQLSQITLGQFIARRDIRNHSNSSLNQKMNRQDTKNAKERTIKPRITRINGTASL